MATTLVPIEEYLHTSYEPDMEYSNGVLIGRNVGTQLHSLLQALVAAHLLQFRKTHRISVLTECRLLMNPRTGRHVIPDVMVLQIPYKKGKVTTDVPAVVVEIQSPDDTLAEVFEKCLSYAEFGVPNIVVLDPDNRRQYVFSDNALQLVSSIDLHLPDSGDVPLPVDAMFAEMDEDLAG